MAEKTLTENQLRDSPDKIPNWAAGDALPKEAVQHLAFSLWRIANALEAVNTMGAQDFARKSQ